LHALACAALCDTPIRSDRIVGSSVTADLSAQILNNPELSQKLLGELVPLLYDKLKATA
jgi:hypothetical protein